VRVRADSTEELARARAAVAEWREQHPEGTGEELVAALGGQFHPDHGPVLRGMLFAADRRLTQLSPRPRLRQTVRPIREDMSRPPA